MARILIMDDDPNIHQILSMYLERDGHTVLQALNGTAGLHLEGEADLLIIDWMMPEVSGLQVIEILRGQGCVKPMLLLTARGDEGDKLQGLDAGADDYVVKPFSPREVTARVRALLRRAGIKEEIILGALMVKPQSHQVWLDGQEVQLSKLEFDLLSAFLSTPGMVWTRDRLLGRVWGSDFPEMDRVVDVHVKNLRKKLHDDPENPTFIETVRGVGYRLREQE
ncbi:response regulator transcription factor [Deinococcus cellulosilyticus]|uniref:DNA-binding response regulator n=1 Tax=Deinococcus cellulosilyticus (strain DSM 18568 / NBRC 106333 / KACC 11606 / 5516J-15) TaxID=1223518 RepID=A0A511N339_DEIC1|nr:response regulator transcription factor [Deinococcus cellulosilyticus]GEM46836.1 DNA-binding response regulator [Deinococcus cellulosilyticus NBRC 106333 = KACC 11606]